MKLQKCPCGQIPTDLNIEEGSSCKYGFASGDCCGEWLIEFRTEYQKLNSKKCKDLAKNAWNGALRSKD